MDNNREEFRCHPALDCLWTLWKEIEVTGPSWKVWLPPISGMRKAKIVERELMSESGKEGGYGQSPTVDPSPSPAFEVTAEPRGVTPMMIDDTKGEIH